METTRRLHRETKTLKLREVHSNSESSTWWSMFNFLVDTLKSLTRPPPRWPPGTYHPWSSKFYAHTNPVHRSLPHARELPYHCRWPTVMHCGHVEFVFCCKVLTQQFQRWLFSHVTLGGTLAEAVEFPPLSPPWLRWPSCDQNCSSAPARGSANPHRCFCCTSPSCSSIFEIAQGSAVPTTAPVAFLPSRSCNYEASFRWWQVGWEELATRPKRQCGQDKWPITYTTTLTSPPLACKQSFAVSLSSEYIEAPQWWHGANLGYNGGETAEHNRDNEEAGQLTTMTRMAPTETTRTTDDNNDEGTHNVAGGQGTDHNEGGRAKERGMREEEQRSHQWPQVSIELILSLFVEDSGDLKDEDQIVFNHSTMS